MTGYAVGYELHGPGGAVVDIGDFVPGGWSRNSFVVGGAEHGAVLEEKGVVVMPWADQALWRDGVLEAIDRAQRLLEGALARHPGGKMAVAGAGGPACAGLANARQVLSVTATRFEIGVPREFAGELWAARAVLRAP